jgi:hypothetical protein
MYLSNVIILNGVPALGETTNVIITKPLVRKH